MLSDLEKLSKMVTLDGPLKDFVKYEVLDQISFKDKVYPIPFFHIGHKKSTSPLLFIVGGIHGIERIGAQLAWSLLKTTLDRLMWDKSLMDLFQNVQLAVVPLANPVGYNHFSRSNGNNVDLMRNSPVDAVDSVPFLLGGQRLSEKLPWYRGSADKMEKEVEAINLKFMEIANTAQTVVSLDFHSGFGMRDRLWFPFSYTRQPFDLLAETHSLFYLFEQTHPYHIYQIEPQSHGYLLNGDLWDYLYLNLKSKKPESIYIPLTLEMGSWTWVRKNPLQLLSRQGIFNPMKEHRLKRTYRRHHLLFDFLLKALYSNSIWSNLDSSIRTKHHNLGLNRWYNRTTD